MLQSEIGTSSRCFSSKYSFMSPTVMYFPLQLIIKFWINSMWSLKIFLCFCSMLRHLFFLEFNFDLKISYCLSHEGHWFWKICWNRIHQLPLKSHLHILFDILMHAYCHQLFHHFFFKIENACWNWTFLNNIPENNQISPKIQKILLHL